MTNDEIHVIESDDYRKEIEILKEDPIILAMYEEVPLAYWSVTGFLTSYQFITSALNEYKARGGSNARTIGGPGRAIKELYEERKTHGH